MLPDDLTYDDWRDAGPKLFRIITSSAWCLGDWLAHGQDRYRERYRHAVAEAGLDYQTLRNYAWVARKFPISRRREALSFQHHAEVAAMSAERQEEWLDHAQRCGWSRNELRRRISLSRRGTTTLRELAFLPRIRVESADLERWRAAADRARSEFDAWVTEALDRAARQALDHHDAQDAAA